MPCLAVIRCYDQDARQEAADVTALGDVATAKAESDHQLIHYGGAFLCGEVLIEWRSG